MKIRTAYMLLLTKQQQEQQPHDIVERKYD